MHDRSDAFEDTTPAVSLREYLEILRRRRAILLQTFVSVLVIGVAVTLFSPPVYHAAARMLVEAPTAYINSVDTENPLADLMSATQNYRVQTQVELLQSADLRKQAAAKVGGALPLLTVTPVNNTEIIEVAAEGSDPETVATAANSLLEVYIAYMSAEGSKSIHNARLFTEKGALKARQDLETTEAALRSFKQKHNVAELDKNRDAQLGAVESLDADYKKIQADLSAQRAQIAATKQQMARQPRTSSGVVSAEADPAIQAMEGQIVTLEAQRAGLLQEYKPVHPRVAAVQAQIATLYQRLARQRASVAVRNARVNPAYEALQDRLIGLEVQASGLAAQAAVTARRSAEARARLANFPSWESEMARLQRRLETARANYELFSKHREMLRLREQTQRTNARIIERAQVPAFPIRPRKLQNILFSALLGVFFGLCLALLQEFLDDRINSPDEADRVLRLPNLGHIPAIEEEGLRLIRDLKTYSPITEAYRSLRTNINFAAVDNPVRTIAVTSSGPSEGKSTTVANLAMAFAMDGKRVIVIDADLRRPTLHKLFGLKPSPGLTDILVGTHALGDVIRATDVDNVRVIPAGSVPPNPAELLGSEAMAHFVDTLRTMADVLVFDSPPTLAVADAVLLSARVDGVLFVVGYGETKKTNARHALDLLAHARAHVLGAVLNKMDTPGRGYYYGQYYYAPAGELAARNGVEHAALNGADAINAAARPQAPAGSRHGVRSAEGESRSAQADAAATTESAMSDVTMELSQYLSKPPANGAEKKDK